MQVRDTLCNPEKCSGDCLDACKHVHGEDSPLGFSREARRPIINLNTCTECLACLRECPFDAIVIATSSGEKSRQSPFALVSTRDASTVRPYEVSDDYQRFPEIDVIFARVYHDPDFSHYTRGIYSDARRMIDKRIPGYGRADFELGASTWKLYDNRKQASETYDWQKTPALRSKPSKPDRRKLTKRIKRAAKFLGAALIGVADLDRRWIYSTSIEGDEYIFPEGINRAIVVAIEMDYDLIDTSPAYPAAVATARGYSQMAYIEIHLAEFIQRMGYRAISCGNNVALSVPLAIDAGLGQYGRHGILITKEYGPRVRIAKILTDMPLIPDRPDAEFCKSVVEFCKACEKCAITCPSQSIPYGIDRTWKGMTKSNNPGVKKWFVEPETCYAFWVQNGNDCSNCIRSCPYNKPNNLLHKFTLWVIQHMPWLNRFVVMMDYLFGFGRQRNPQTVWAKHD
ncbi:MAG: reductive dehalogenase [Candidatus Thorarchaeota archaeon]|nr:MAG: reductive dehalogenase [Candidatus Thorarchaeota archaeon]